MLIGIPLQVTMKCPSCHQPAHVQGLSEAMVCGACQENISLPPSWWLGWFGFAEIIEALGCSEGEGNRVSGFWQGQEATYSYGRRMPRCQSCKTDLPADQLAAMAAAGGWSCSCGKLIRVRDATALSEKIVPGARWLVHEGKTGADGAEPIQAREPIMFACMSCGGGLEVDGTARTVTCRFCSGSNYLPDGLWLRLHPQQTVQTFFVVCELTPADPEGEPETSPQETNWMTDDDSVMTGASRWRLPPAYLASMATDEDDEVRAAAALNPGASSEMLERLAQDDEWDVRRAAVQSGRLSEPTLQRLIQEESDSDVLEALAALPLTPALLISLAGHREYGLRVITAQNPATPDAALITLAADDDSDVLEALCARPLPAEALKSLSQRDRRHADRLRPLIARHADTPPAVLLGMLDDEIPWAVRRALAQHPALPAEGVLRLALHDDESIAATAKAHAAYPEALKAHRAQRRRRLLITAGVLLILGVVAAVVAAVGLLVAYLTGKLPL